jgi:hypothetical protein
VNRAGRWPAAAAIRRRVVAATSLVVVAIAVLAALAATRGTSPPAAEGPPPSPGPPGVDWVEAASVERPAGMTADPPSISPVGNGGGLGHPGHFSGQGNPFDVAAGPGLLVAVGYTYPEFHGVTWTSTDRQTWSLHEISPGQVETFVLSIVAGPGGWVAVGRHAAEAAAWSSADGLAWQPATAAGGDGFREPPETQMTTVVATPGGYLAGGWAGLFTAPGHARFWTSTDGTEWTRLADDPAFDDGRVLSIAAGPAGYVAVGTTGPAGRPTGSAVWRSPDGARWTRIDGSAVLADGAMASVIAGGPGYLAVGANIESSRALVWLSADGVTWTLAPDQASLTNHDLKLAMADAVVGADGTIVAVGHYLFGTQYGQGATWTSPDRGRTWTRGPDLAAFGQGAPVSVIADGPGYVAVGTVGAPDNFIPKVWLSPRRP